MEFQEIHGYADEELLYELGQRFDHWVFVGLKRSCDAQGGDEWLRDYDGDEDLCYALCGNMQRFIDKSQEDVEED